MKKTIIHISQSKRILASLIEGGHDSGGRSYSLSRLGSPQGRAVRQLPRGGSLTWPPSLRFRGSELMFGEHQEPRKDRAAEANLFRGEKALRCSAERSNAKRLKEVTPVENSNPTVCGKKPTGFELSIFNPLRMQWYIIAAGVYHQP